MTPTAVMDPVELAGTTVARASLHNPDLLAKEYYSFPIYSIVEICAEYEDIPQDMLDNFFKETEEHAKFLLDCIKVK